MSVTKILLVDTEKNVLLAYKNVLEEEGYQVEIASSEEESLEKLSPKSASVVITESYLKNKSTTNLIKKIKHLYPEMYIIMISAIILKPDSYEEVINAGVDDYFPKPFSTRNLLITIKKGLKRRLLVLRNVQFEERLKYIEHLLTTDPYYSSSGRIICNTLYFHKKLREEIMRAERYKTHFSLLLFDLDPSDNGYKHLEPDKKQKISKEVSRILLDNTRQTDIITQYNGNFALILLETPHSGAKLLTERLQEHIITTFVLQDKLQNKQLLNNVKFDLISYPEHSQLINKWVSEAEKKRSN
jgi:diguanylate cyclase (GGDEF)-like protein